MRDNLRRVVDYAANPEKTEYGALSQALHYAGNDAKTTLPESAKLVSGIHCRPETAWADMRAVQRKFGKTEGVVAMHAYQSFQPGEVTPEQCHAIGVELARQVWGGRFQVLVATHMNTHCLHNHFVINAVSYVDGKKYEQRRSQYRELRRASDALCRAQGLSVVQTPGKSTPRPLYEAERRGEPTRYNRMREALRSALQQTSTEEDFALALRRMGYLWRREEGRFFGRRISVKASCDAAAILLLYVTLFFFGGFIISSVEGLPLADCLFETASAVGTVGLSLGLTPSLGLVSRGVLIFLMYMGRVGGLTLIYAALAGAAKTGSKLPQERITIG